MGEKILEVTGVSAGYGGPPIIQNIVMSAEAGAITALVGPNGAGKSTLLKSLAGVLKPSTGSIKLNGLEVAGLSPESMAANGLSYVPQVSNVFPYLSIVENLEIGGYVRRRKGLKGRIDEMLDLFPDLRKAGKRNARTLSGGQRNMLAMARGLMSDPKVLFLDEPTAGLSPIYVSTVWDHILTVRNLGVSVVVVEQNTRRTLQHADYAFVLTLGQNRIQGTGAELLNDPEVARLYIGGETKPE